MKSGHQLSAELTSMIPANILFFKLQGPSDNPRNLSTLEQQEVNCVKSSDTFITMGKRSRTDSNHGENQINPKEGASKLFLAEDKAVDPTLALLFASSVSLKIVASLMFADLY